VQKEGGRMGEGKPIKRRRNQRTPTPPTPPTQLFKERFSRQVKHNKQLDQPELCTIK
jgi:hypothetical protein